MSSVALADDRRIRLREPGVYFSIAKDENFFDPAYARQIYATVDAKELDELDNHVPEEAWDAFLAWRDVLDKSPRKALTALDAHPHRKHIERIYDGWTIYYSWRTMYREFPNFLMSYEDWQADNAPKCSERNPGDPYTSACLPIPDWRSDKAKQLDAESLAKGKRARAAWKNSPCKAIWDDREANSLEIRKAEWNAHDCDAKQRLVNYRKDPDR